MSIAAECPHCETRFHLQPELAGRTMRCPNPDCRQVFEVAAALPPLPMMPRDETPAPSPPPPPPRRPEPVVVEAQLAPVQPKPKPKPPKPPKVVEAQVVSPAKPAGGPKEVVWTPGADLPPAAPPPPAPKAREYEERYEEPVRRRRKRGRNLGPMILVGLLVLLVLVGGAAGLYILKYQGKVQEQAVEKAKELYEKREYAKAKKAFDDLAADYPGHADADEYRFFADLAQVRQAAFALTNRENPRPAVAALKEFVGTRKDSPFARPDKFGYDVFDAGKKVAEDAAGYAQDRVKTFGGDRGKLDELKHAEEVLAAGRELPPLLEPFRPKDKDIPGFDDSLAKFAAVEADVGKAQPALAKLDQAKGMLDPPTEQAMVEAKAFLAAHGLTDDAEARGLMTTAGPSSSAASATTPTPPRPCRRPPRRPRLVRVRRPRRRRQGGAAEPARQPADRLPGVARGVLYALGRGQRRPVVGGASRADTFDPPAVVTLDSADGPTSLALVLGNVAGQPRRRAACSRPAR